MGEIGWVKYPSLERAEQLPSSGLELLGKILTWTEKRDGSNVSVWLYDKLDFGGNMLDTLSVGGRDYKVVISSRNQSVAAGDIISELKSSKEYARVLEYLKEFPNHVLFGELIRIGHTPTRVEPVHKKPSYVMFDIYDREFKETTGAFMGYNGMYQQMYHYKIPVVTLLGITRHVRLLPSEEEKKNLENVRLESLFSKYSNFKNAVRDGMTVEEMAVSDDSFYFMRDIVLRWAKRHRREGTVVKTFDDERNPLYVKEKVDLPSKERIHSVSRNLTVQLPPLPYSEIMGAIDKVRADIGTEDFMNKAKAMPLVVKYVNEECKKHCCSEPKGKLYEYYNEFLRGLMPNVK